MEKYAFIFFIWPIFLIGQLSAVESEEQNGYIFISPRSLQTGGTNQLQLWRTGALEECTVNVKVTRSDSYSSNETVAVEESFSVPEGENSSVFGLNVPSYDTFSYSGKIAVDVKCGDDSFGGKDTLYFARSPVNMTLTQTDKPIYKAGQTVKFRVMKMDRYLLPLVKDEATIYVLEPSGTKVFQWKGVCLGKGIKQFEFQLPDEPPLGEWRIVVKFHGQDQSTSTFKVSEYVLPKFEVTIKPPSFVLANAEEFPITICAKYTYGKPVKGNMKLNISLETYSWSNDKLPTIEIETKIDGCYVYNINVSHIETEEYYRYRRIECKVSVEEDGTGTVRNATEYIQRQFTPLTCSFSREQQKQYYKPGIPYIGKLLVKYPNDTAAPDEDFQVCCTVTKERVVMDGMWKATRTVKYCQNYTSDHKGEIDFIVPRQNVDSMNINLEAKSLKYLPNSKKSGTQRQNSLSQPQTSMSLTPWFSPSGSFIQLQQVQENLMCGTKRHIKLLFTSDKDQTFKFRYEILSKNTIIDNGTVETFFETKDDVAEKYELKDLIIDDAEVQIVPSRDEGTYDGGSTDSNSLSEPREECKSAKEARYVPFIGEVNINVEIDSRMASGFHLLVYYVRPDRETIADSQKYSVEKCFKNQVKLQFGDEMKQPGTKTSIRVTSSPNSLCGVKIVDKSVSLLEKDDQVTPEKIFSMLDSMDSGIYYGQNYCNEEIRQPGMYSSSSRIMPPRPPQPWSSSNYEDSMTAFQNAGYLVISNLPIFVRPCKSRGSGNIVYEDSNYGGYGGAVNSKVALASTARRPPASPAMAGAPAAADQVSGFAAATKSVVDVRDYFPETWLFDMFQTGEEGTYVTKEKLPHTITEWVGSAICINDEDGLGLSPTTTIKGFQAFFVSLELPYSAIRGEEFSINVQIFSYVPQHMPISVSMDDPEGFEVLDGSKKEEICLPPQGSYTLKIKVKGTQLGTQNLTIRAETAQGSTVCGDKDISDALAKDAITKPMLINAEGYPVEKVESIMICPKDEENEVFTKTISIEEPVDYVADSLRCYIDYSGTFMGQSINDPDHLLNIPTGCGEQNLAKCIPNVVVLETMQALGELDEKTKNLAEKNLKIGSMRQMNYIRSDGSSSAFGERDKNGSMFLTAMFAKTFSAMSKHILIDNKTISKAQDWIVSNQQSDGCFANIGKIFDKGMEGAINRDDSGDLTAYVLISLLLSDYNNDTVKEKALSCIRNSKDTSFHATFLFAYAEALAGESDAAKERIKSVEGKAIIDGKSHYYHDMNATKSHDLETNGYAILAMLSCGLPPADVLPLIQYLTQNLNPNGGFYTTQDTAVCFEAMGKFLQKTYNDDLNISIELSGGENDKITMTNDNKVLLQRRKVDVVPSNIELAAKGEGCAVVQVVQKYNTKTSPEKKNFIVKAEAVSYDKNCKRGSIKVEVSPLKSTMGMVLVEIIPVTGMAFVKDSLERLKDDKNMELMRYDIENDKCVLYFAQIPNNSKKSFEVEWEEIFEVENAQPGQVKAYDYYNRDTSGSATFEKGSCGESSSPESKSEP